MCPKDLERQLGFCVILLRTPRRGGRGMWILESEQNLRPHERRRPWILDFEFFVYLRQNYFRAEDLVAGGADFLRPPPL